MDRGARRATVPGVADSDTPESMHTRTEIDGSGAGPALGALPVVPVRGPGDVLSTGPTPSLCPGPTYRVPRARMQGSLGSAKVSEGGVYRLGAQAHPGGRTDTS